MSNKYEGVLIGGEIEQVISSIGIKPVFSYRQVAVVIQQAVLEKLVEQQEPVAWVHPTDPTRSITHHQKLGAIKDGGAIEKTTRVFSIPAYAHPIPTIDQEPVAWKIGLFVSSSKNEVISNVRNPDLVPVPLYTHPIPNSQGILDNSNHIADASKMVFDPGAALTLAERTLSVEITERLADELIEFARALHEKYTQTDHIPEIGKMITPLAQRKIQTLLDKGEYRAIDGAIVLVNDLGHAAIVNHGGAFYWVDNEALAREFDAAAVGVDSDHIADMRKKVPEGWRLIPKEATDDMYRAFCHVRNDIEPDEFREAYRAVTEAAPKYTGKSK